MKLLALFACLASCATAPGPDATMPMSSALSGPVCSPPCVAPATCHNITPPVGVPPSLHGVCYR